MALTQNKLDLMSVQARMKIFSLQRDYYGNYYAVEEAQNGTEQIQTDKGLQQLVAVSGAGVPELLPKVGV